MKTLLTIVAILTTSCAEFPVTLAVEGEHGTYSYSAKDGVVIEINTTK